jgi:CheY-like chemotaxis protein
MLPHDRILLVEDDEDQVELICRVLEEHRVSNKVHSVSTVGEARAYLTGEGVYADRLAYPIPCLVLLDLKLPGGSGFELLNWMRSRPELQRLPVVVLTHSQSQGDIERAYALGANSYVVKPFDSDQFRATIKAVNAYWILLAEKPRY